MIHVYVIVEGVTEEVFVKRALAPALALRGVSLVPILVGLARARARRGGRVRLDRVTDHVVRMLKQQRDCTCTTMLDYYGLGRGFEKLPASERCTVEQRAVRVELQMAEAVSRRLGASFDRRRFLPYLQMHEFEALLFSSPAKLARGLGDQRLEGCLQDISIAVQSPEEIDDGPQTAPSKRILALAPGYQKVNQGVAVALDIGVETLQQSCPRFAGWVEAICGPGLPG